MSALRATRGNGTEATGADAGRDDGMGQRHFCLRIGDSKKYQLNAANGTVNASCTTKTTGAEVKWLWSQWPKQECRT